MNSLELIDELRTLTRRSGNTLDKAYDSGIRRAIRAILELTQGDVEYCPRCAKIAEMFAQGEE